MESLDYKNENIKRKYVNNMQNNQFLKIKNKLLESKKTFYGIEILREIEELFYKLIIVSKDDMGKFEEQEMNKISPMVN